MTLAVHAAAAAGDLVVAVDLDVAAGETVAVLGPNGAGKTTLLRMISGLLPLTDGLIALEGRGLDDVPPEDRGIGVLFQDLLLFEHLDVLENVAFGLRASGVRKPDAHREAQVWLDRLGVGSLAAAGPARLSGGEAQRVALARALAPGPRALLLDEPLSALDADVRGEVRRTLRDHLRAHHQGPCIVVTHDPLDAAVLADRVVVLEDGRITAEGSLESLVARPRTAWAAELAGTNLLPGEARGGVVDLPGGGVVAVAEPPGDGPVLVAIRPASVTLHQNRPEGSARNVWQGQVLGLEGFGERVRVRVTSIVPLVAEVTPGAVADLRLDTGAPVWLSVKATEVAAYPA